MCLWFWLLYPAIQIHCLWKCANTFWTGEREIRNVFAHFQLQVPLLNIKCIWPMIINVLCTVHVSLLITKPKSQNYIIEQTLKLTCQNRTSTCICMYIRQKNICLFQITWAYKTESVGRDFSFFAIFFIVPRVRFLLKNNKIVNFRTDFRQMLSSKPHNFSI